MAAQADVILSICPPAFAETTFASVAGFHGLYVDANAISPTTSRRLETAVTRGGGAYVDGGIIGRPPLSSGDARLYVSGPEARTSAALFDDTVVDARVVSGDIGAASALKLAYASWTKGAMALLINSYELAERESVAEALVDEWSESRPRLLDEHDRAVRTTEKKGWRWAGEMTEIGEAMRSVDLPDGFYLAARHVFERK